MYNKLLWVEKFGSIVGFIVLSSLAFIALSEKEITIGSPKSFLITHSSGFSAVLLGFLFLVGALGCIGYLLKYTDFYRLYLFVAFSAWLAFIAWYLMTNL